MPTKKRSSILFDDALPLFCELVVRELGEKALKANAFLRDADGTITFIARTKISGAQRQRLAAAAKNALGTYVGSVPVASPSDMFDSRLEGANHDQLELVHWKREERFVRLIERRIIGQDWLRGILPEISGVPPVVVFASHKGGVGRSTALAVAAADFSSRGKSVLAIDLDLEAPGLGCMLFGNRDLPEFGTLDYFIENGRGNVDKNFLENMTGISSLTGGKGEVTVIPGIGRRCREFPQNVIGKLSRAYLEDIQNDEAASFLDQSRQLIKDVCADKSYDLVLIDTRAGLNETTATTIQGLGADVLFFGVDTPQTWEGYRYFLAHLARFKLADNLAPDSEWRYRIKMVHAKALANPKAQARFRDRAFDLFAENFYDSVDEASDDDSEDDFGFDLNDRTAPHYAWPILNDATYFEFDPLARHDLLLEPVYSRTFEKFLSGLSDRLGIK